MNLIIDIGNTRIKAGLFEQNSLKHFFVFETSSHDPEIVSPAVKGSSALIAADLFNKYAIDQCIVASVVDGMEPFTNQLKEKATILIFESTMPSPVKNLYQSTNTLGTDRFAAAIGGNSVFPNKNVLVIDAGTCIKYNFVNSNNEFLGGAISPGLQMRFNSLNTFTSRLPLIQVEEDFDSLIGSNTKESILSGVAIGIVAEVDGIIERYQHIYPDITVILTGGDTNFFEKRLKSRIFTDSFIILKGLNRVLEYTINEK